MAVEPEKTEENADFERGLYVCEHPGHEFVNAGSSGTTMGLFCTQLFAMLFLIPAVGFFGMRNLAGASMWASALVTGVLLAVVLIAGIVMLRRINRVNQNKNAGTFYTNESDSRFRVRVVIPKKQQGAKIVEWARAMSDEIASEVVGEEADMTAEELEMIRGGFEPMIVRPWFGLKRDRFYWRTFAIMCVVVGFGAMVLLSQVLGNWKSIMQSFGFLTYAGMGLMMVGGVVSAELIWPTYLRLVPGQLDVFRFGFLGSGKPTVESFDLRSVGVCVDFGRHIAVIEPPRPIGEPLPKLVQAKRWPHAQAFPEDYTPIYIALTMTSSRRLFAQRLIQAARTDEPTPIVPMDRLGE